MAPLKNVVLIDMDNTLVNMDKEFRKRWAAARPFDDLEVIANRGHFEMKMNFEGDARTTAVDILSSAGFFIEFEPMAGAIEAVKEMVDVEGLSVFFCTAPTRMQYETCAAEKFAWVRKHFGEKYLSKIILGRDKTVIKGTVLIDDKPKISGANEEPEWTHIMFTQSYNKKVVAKHRMADWSQWRDVVLPLLKS